MTDTTWKREVALMLDALPDNHGFATEQEFIRMVAAVDLSVPGIMTPFRAWQYFDGTKAGLAKLIERSRNAQPVEPPQ